MKVGDKVRVVASVDKDDIIGGHEFTRKIGTVVSTVDDHTSLDFKVKFEWPAHNVPFYKEELEVIE